MLCPQVLARGGVGGLVLSAKRSACSLRRAGTLERGQRQSLVEIPRIGGPTSILRLVPILPQAVVKTGAKAKAGAKATATRKVRLLGRDVPVYLVWMERMEDGSWVSVDPTAPAAHLGTIWEARVCLGTSLTCTAGAYATDHTWRPAPALGTLIRPAARRAVASVGSGWGGL